MAYTDPSTLTFTTGQIVTAAEMNTATNEQFLAVLPDGVEGVAWSPVLEGSTTDFDTDSVSGIQYRKGALLYLWATWTFPGSGEQNGSGTMFVTLPVAASGIGASQAIGAGFGSDSGTAANGRNCVVFLVSTTVARFRQADAGSAFTASSPFTWDTNDVLSFQAVYPIA